VIEEEKPKIDKKEFQKLQPIKKLTRNNIIYQETT
jgi:hypothetical protein